MAALKWMLIAVLSIIGGLLGHQLTGNWFGAAAAAVGCGLSLRMLFHTQWLKAAVAAGVTVFLVFSLMDDGTGRIESKPTPKSKLADKEQAPAQGGADALVPKDGVVQPSTRDTAKLQAPATGSVGNIPVLQDCVDCPQMVVVPAGQFLMGSLGAPNSAGAAGGLNEPVDPREGPSHRVSVRSFAVGRYAVTYAEFAAFVRATGYVTQAEQNRGCLAWTGDKWENNTASNWRQAGFQQGDNHPVVCVSWNDAQAYTKWLSGVSKKNYRLLSEAEREYSSRAGSTTTFWWGDNLTTHHANYDTTAPGYRGSHNGEWRRATVPVDQFSANPFGLYNVHGNVWEWVQDCQHDTYTGAPIDGSAWTGKCSGNGRVIRGGAWVGDPAGLRATSRGWFATDFRFHAGGFRVARSVSLQK